MEAQGPGAAGPHSFPASRTYNTSAAGAGKINVLVPHSHDDTGWQVTVDQYFANEVFFIIDTVMESLSRDPNRKFIYVETGFARWWEQASDAKRAMAKAQVKGKQLEFINGAWCMHDEACHCGRRWSTRRRAATSSCSRTLGRRRRRAATADRPVGYSQTEAWLLGAEAGCESIYWGRMDGQDRQMRFNKEQGTDGFEWIWQGESLGASAQIFAGTLHGQGGGGYSTWFNFNDGDEDQIIDDPARHDWNVDQWVDKFVQVLSQANHTLSEHQMWACGTDFQYQNADLWYTNLDKLIHYVNMNGTVNAFYSTPSVYTDEKKKWRGSYEVRKDDIFPLADNPHHYWSGYFTSRRRSSGRCASPPTSSSRRASSKSSRTSPPPTSPCRRRSGRCRWATVADSPEGTVSVATHHDGMSGTDARTS